MYQVKYKRFNSLKMYYMNIYYFIVETATEFAATYDYGENFIRFGTSSNLVNKIYETKIQKSNN